MEKEGNMITDWLDQNGDPEIEYFIKKNLAITEKVRLALENKGWSKLQLAEAMHKNPSEISKWLSGMHNLTLKSIIKMEVVLGVDLIHTEAVKEYEYVYLGVIENQNVICNKATKYTETTEMQEYLLAM
ncbi:MAG: helix-turn-helix domain-containing protein [Bacteroidales bacterium]